MKKAFKTKIAIVCFALVLGICLSAAALLPVFAQTGDEAVLTTTAVKDTYINGANSLQGLNFGASTQLRSASTIRTYVQFDVKNILSELGSKAVNSVDLVLQLESGSTPDFTKDLIVSVEKAEIANSNLWAEGTGDDSGEAAADANADGLTWTNKKFTTSSAIKQTVTYDYDETSGELRIHLPKDVLSAATVTNYSEADAQNNFISFLIYNSKFNAYSKEYNDGEKAPRLEVTPGAEIVYNTVSFSAGDNGTVTAAVGGVAVESGDAVQQGKTVVFAFTPSDGYEVEAVTLNGEDVTSQLVSGKLSVAVSQNITLAVTFKVRQIPNYTITVADIENCTVTLTAGGEPIASGATLPEGTVIGIRVTVDEGYKIMTVKANGEDVQGAEGDYSLTLAADTTLEVAISSGVKYTVAWNDNIENGSVTVLSGVMELFNGQEIDENSTIVFKFHADLGYKPQLTINGQTQTVEANRCSVELTENIQAEVSFAEADLEVYEYGAIRDTTLIKAAQYSCDGEAQIIRAGNNGAVNSYLQFDVSSFIATGITANTLELVVHVDNIVPKTGSDIANTIANIGIRVLNKAINGWEEVQQDKSADTTQWDYFATATGSDLNVTNARYDEATGLLYIPLNASWLSSANYVETSGENAGYINFRFCVRNSNGNIYYYSKEGAAADNTRTAPYLAINRAYETSATSANSQMGSAQSSKRIVKAGDGVTFTVTVNQGYALYEVTLNGVNVTNEMTKDGNVYTYTVNNVQQAQSLVARFTDAKVYTVTIADVPDGGSVSVDNPNVIEGGSVEFTITAMEDFTIASALLNGQDVLSQIVDGKLSVTNVTENLNLVVTFQSSRARYTLTVSGNDGGLVYIGSDESQTSFTDWASEWEKGGQLKVTILPLPGYVVKGITVNGRAEVLQGYVYVINKERVTENLTLVAEFEEISYTTDSTVFQPVADTGLDSGEKDVCLGGNVKAGVKSTTKQWRLYALEFDISKITNFSEVLLKIYTGTSANFGSYKLGLYAFSGMTLDETIVTWNGLSLDNIIISDSTKTIHTMKVGTKVATLEPADVNKQAWTVFDITKYIMYAKVCGIDRVTFVVLNEEIGYTGSSTIEYETRESMTLYDGTLNRPYISVTKTQEGDDKPIIKQEIDVTVSGDSSVKLNGEATSKITVDKYATVEVDLSGITNKAVDKVLVNGEEVEIVDGKVYLNGYDVNVNIEIVTLPWHYIDIETDSHVTVQEKELKVAEGTSVEIVFVVEKGYKVTVTVGGAAYVPQNNTIIIEDIDGDMDIVITSEKL